MKNKNDREKETSTTVSAWQIYNAKRRIDLCVGMIKPCLISLAMSVGALCVTNSLNLHDIDILFIICVVLGGLGLVFNVTVIMWYIRWLAKHENG